MKTSEECLSFLKNRLYYPKTGLLYDIVIESEDEYPIPSANFPRMEDCMISGGTALHGLCEHMERTNGAEAEFAARIADGILKSAAAGKDGFMPRGVHPADGKTHWLECSRDQITMALYGLLRYAFSGFCTEEMKNRIAAAAAAIADRAIRNVIPENDYNMLTEDGKYAVNSVMWGEKIMSHEIFRLPQIYLTAYVLTNREEYRERYLSIRDEALEKSRDIKECWRMYAFQQMAVSIDTAGRFDNDPRTKKICGEILDAIADFTGRKIPEIRQDIAVIPESAFSLRDEKYWNFYRIQEAAIVPMLEALAPHRGISEESKALCMETLAKIPYSGKTALPVHFYTALELLKRRVETEFPG